jgi:protocatechuate 3,4-dioxygenase alpha subunit
VTTPGQTVGPFFGGALPYEKGQDLVPPGSPGAIRLHGHVYDGAGAPVPDALLEIWQPDRDGNVVRQAGSLRRDGWTFTGWGRAETDPAGHYSFSTLRPGGPNPFFAVTVFARGLTDRLFTRAYLPSPEDNPFLNGLPEEDRATLIVTPDEQGFVFDVRLQGPGETVFLRHTGPR